jgi:hypothetical protein
MMNGPPDSQPFPGFRRHLFGWDQDGIDLQPGTRRGEQPSMEFPVISHGNKNPVGGTKVDNAHQAGS